jgi:ABC-type branched-subunit amino acid transport system substrate-binding protein
MAPFHTWLRRGQALLAALLVCAVLPSAKAEPGITGDEIRLGQSTALSGPLAELGNDMSAAARAYFEYINAQGGVHGRKITLVTLDDGYNTDKAVANAKQLIEKENVFALFSLFGTPANTALLPVITQAGIPNIAPYTGSEAVRKPLNRHVFNVRAGYADETEKIIEHLGVRGIGKVAVVYQNNAFGKDGLAGVEQALAKRKLQVAGAAPIENDASDAEKAAAALAAATPQAVVMITAGKPSAEFIKAYNRIAPGMQFFTLSVMGTQASVAVLGKEGIGVVVSQVVPFPFSATSGIVREYQQIMTKMGVKNWSFASMEGFINAKVTVEGLKRAGRDLTRERLMAALESMSKVDFDGYMVDFGRSRRQGSHYVELTVISRDGRFLR